MRAYDERDNMVFEKQYDNLNELLKEINGVAIRPNVKRIEIVKEDDFRCPQPGLCPHHEDNREGTRNHIIINADYCKHEERFLFRMKECPLEKKPEAADEAE